MFKLLFFLILDLLGINQPSGTAIKRSELPASSTPHYQLTMDMYNCFKGAGDMTSQQSMESEACNRMMEGRRSSNDDSIPQGSDTVEMFISKGKTVHQCL